MATQSSRHPLVRRAQAGRADVAGGSARVHADRGAGSRERSGHEAGQAAGVAGLAERDGARDDALGRILARTVRERSSAPPRLARVARDVAAAPQTGGDVVTREVNRRIEETISNAPAVYRQWNDRFGWWAKYQLRLDEWELTRQLEVRVRLYCNTAATVKDGWTRAILAKWSNKFSFAVLREAPIVNRAGGVDDVLESYPIRIRIEWVDDPTKAHYVLTANEPGAHEDGRAGTDGTTSMTGWGKTDRTDVPHEFGHILGCPEEYFTTNGVDYTRGGTERGYRDEDGGVMNNPSGPAMARNFQTIRSEAAAMRGVPLNRTRVQ